MNVPTLLAFPQRCHHRAVVLLIGYAGVVCSTPAHATPPTPQSGESSSARFDLHYTAPPDCPNERAFLDWTNQFYFANTDGTDAESPHSPTRAWQASDGELAGSVRVKVVRAGSRFIAHLVMVNADGRCSTSRPMHNETDCADAVRAMAYSLAEALKAPPCASEPASPANDERPCPKPNPLAARPPNLCPAQSPCPPREVAIQGEVGVSAGGMGPLAEEIAWGGALILGFRNERGIPSARLSVGYWKAGRVPLGVDLRAQAWTTGASLCPFELGLSRLIAVPLCATAEVGQVAISGFHTASQRSSPDNAEETAADDGDHANLYLWTAFGVAARLRLRSRWLFTEFEPSLAFPVLRHSVYTHQPSSETTERQLMGRVGQWYALRALVNAGFVFP